MPEQGAVRHRRLGGGRLPADDLGSLPLGYAAAASRHPGRLDVRRPDGSRSPAPPTRPRCRPSPSTGSIAGPTNQTVNGDLVPARPNIQTVVIAPWLAASGGKILDMTKAPFRLLAIVARLDLRENAGYSGGSLGRRGAVRLRPARRRRQPHPVPGDLRVRARRRRLRRRPQVGQRSGTAWAATRSGRTTTPPCRRVTDRFATIGASPGKPNGSAINQVRTDEIQLVLPDTLWELREFKLMQPGDDASAPPCRSPRAPSPRPRPAASSTRPRSRPTSTPTRRPSWPTTTWCR